MAAPVLIAFVSHDGQTGRIADRLGDRLAAQNIPVDVVDIRRSACAPEGVRAVVFGAPLRYGRFPKTARKWIARHATALERIPGAFFSVSLAAASTRPQDASAAERLRDAMLTDTGWQPTHRASFAGALRYTAYGPLLRMVMRRIARKSGGDTDTTRDHDYADWAAVDAFADDVAATLATGA